jgi:prolyl-tRNA synthetase
MEKTPCHLTGEAKSSEEERPLELAATPEACTVQDVASYLQVNTDQILKSLFYNVDGKIVVVLVRRVLAEKLSSTKKTCFPRYCLSSSNRASVSR